MIPITSTCKLYRIKRRAISRFHFRITFSSWICTIYALWPWQSLFLLKLLLPHIRSGSRFSHKSMRWTFRGLIPYKSIRIFLLQKVQFGTEAFPTTYSMGSGRIYLLSQIGRVMKLVLSFHLVLSLRAIFFPPICLNGVNNDTFTLKYIK